MLERVAAVPIGIGYYSGPEAARLLRTSPGNISRWLGGYTYKSRGVVTEAPPLWTSQLPISEGHIELGFRDLIELRFVLAFKQAGLGLKTIRNCLELAQECVNDPHPFSTRRFQTDGRTIFLDSLKKSGEDEVLDLKKRQYVFRQVIAESFKDLDIDQDAVVRWRPFQGKNTIIVDPTRAFGQPIVGECGVPTVVLADAVRAEGSVERVAELYETSAPLVRDAVKFEDFLIAA
jgi:uncharacterized protein (DUF433 family)/DNA-binding transcriptional MerR regulator